MAGERELLLTRKLFDRVERHDAALADMLDELVVFTNLEGLTTVGREAVTRLFCAPGTGTSHELVSIEGSAGRAIAVFVLAVPGVAGVLLLEAELHFEHELVVAMEIRPAERPSDARMN